MPLQDLWRLWRGLKCRTCRKLLSYICENGFEHHCAVNLTQVAAPVKEAFGKYMGWGRLSSSVEERQWGKRGGDWGVGWGY
jgi:hypothetical protein